jgi:toxin YoeB
VVPERRREVVLDAAFLADLAYWIEVERRVASRLVQLIEAIRRDPFHGIGKPEPLKRLGSNTWSRRLTDEHRVVYRVENERIVFLQGRYHYGR